MKMIERLKPGQLVIFPSKDVEYLALILNLNKADGIVTVRWLHHWDKLDAGPFNAYYWLDSSLVQNLRII